MNLFNYKIILNYLLILPGPAVTVVHIMQSVERKQEIKEKHFSEHLTPGLVFHFNGLSEGTQSV